MSIEDEGRVIKLYLNIIWKISCTISEKWLNPNQIIQVGNERGLTEILA